MDRPNTVSVYTVSAAHWAKKSSVVQPGASALLTERVSGVWNTHIWFPFVALRCHELSFIQRTQIFLIFFLKKERKHKCHILRLSGLIYWLVYVYLCFKVNTHARHGTTRGTTHCNVHTHAHIHTHTHYGTTRSATHCNVHTHTWALGQPQSTRFVVWYSREIAHKMTSHAH